jgi:eukaryotic-like serine/threonine-protein kinase
MKKYVISALIILVIACTFSGCSPAVSRGWSGFAASDGILYYASMSGKAIAVNPSVRSTSINATFPGSQEWAYTFKQAATGGGFCGPSCTSSAPVGMVLYSTPTVSKDLAFYATFAGRVYAFNLKTGADRWVYPRESSDSIGPVIGNIVLANDTIYLNSSSGIVIALDSSTGDKKWIYQVGDKIWTSPVVSDGIVYTGCYDGKFYAIRGDNGTGLWQVKLPTAVSSSPAISKNTIIVGTFDHKLMSLNNSDGSTRWTFSGSNWFWATPVVADNIVYAANLDRKIYALNVDSGKEIWEFIGDSPFISTPVIVNGMLAAVSESGTLYLINLADGISKKDMSLGFQAVAPLYAGGDTIYVHTKDDYIHAININDGKEIWKFKSENKQE